MSSAEALLVRDLGFLTALRAAAPEAAAAFHDPGRRRYRVGLTVLAGVAAVGLAIGLYFWGIPALATVLAARVPVSWEVALGNAAMAELAPAARRCVDREQQGRIDAITETLVKTLPESRYPFRVIVANNPTVNALATPGGSIVVFRGLLERTENAEELAGVLAHEIQHVMHRHSTKAILRQASAGVLMAALVGDVSAVVAFGLQSARTLGDLRYSRQAELEADRDGARMLHAAAVDPAGMVSFFQAMQQRGGDAADRDALPVNPSGGGRPPAGADGAGRRLARAARQAAARRGLERGQEDVRRAAWIRALTRAAWAGPAVSRTPSGASASSTALAMAAGGEMAPPSPSPLAPSGLRGDGYSRCTHSIHGRSSARGHHVVHQRARQQLALAVVDDVLEQPAAHPLGNAAVDLALDDHRVDDLAAVVGHDVAQQLARRRSRRPPRPAPRARRWRT